MINFLTNARSSVSKRSSHLLDLLQDFLWHSTLVSAIYQYHKDSEKESWAVWEQYLNSKSVTKKRSTPNIPQYFFSHRSFNKYFLNIETLCSVLLGQGCSKCWVRVKKKNVKLFAFGFLLRVTLKKWNPGHSTDECNCSLITECYSTSCLQLIQGVTKCLLSFSAWSILLSTTGR